jgi:ornithine carbamoyltransferase
MKNSVLKGSLRSNGNTKHLLTGEEFSPQHIEKILLHALTLKKERMLKQCKPELAGCHLALIFDKPSLRTRFSFAAAMRELGGDVIESVGTTRKAETPEDQARVLSGYCHAIMVRTHADTILERMSQVSSAPIINGLSNLHHPCQIFADLLTLLEVFDSLQGLTLSYIGDGNNILHSLLLLAPQMGINVHYCCPQTRGPDEIILKKSLAAVSEKTGKIQVFSKPELAVHQSHAIYTDVWASMGFEDKSADHLFAGFQVNEQLMQHANPQAVFMHCLPMERGKEVSETLPDQPCSVIFQQSENRLHVQKALLLDLLKI